MTRWPAPPWRLESRLLVVPVLVREGIATPGTDAVLRVPQVGGAVAGLLVLAVHGEESTLAYGELAVVVGARTRWRGRSPAKREAARAVTGRVPFPGWAPPIPVGLVAAIWVDDPLSLAGGRAEWGVPKQPARFTWEVPPPADADSGGGSRRRSRARPDGLPAVTAEVCDEHGGRLLRLDWTQTRARSPLPVRARFAGTLGAETRIARLTGRLRAGPARVRAQVPATSPLAGLSVAPVGAAGTGWFRADAAEVVRPGRARR